MPGPRRKVLIVDDVADVADLLALFLQAQGHEVACAYSGPEAVAAAASFRPDAVILDIHMPRLTGYDVARALRDPKRAPRPVLIAISAVAEESDKLAARMVGFDHFLPKPIEREAVLRILRSIAPAAPRKAYPAL